MQDVLIREDITEAILNQTKVSTEVLHTLRTRHPAALYRLVIRYSSNRNGTWPAHSAETRIAGYYLKDQEQHNTWPALAHTCLRNAFR